MVVGIVNKVELIFNIHKEDIIEGTISYRSNLRKKYDLSVEEVHDAFVKIINYQIDKYGSQKQGYTDYVSKDECYLNNRRALQRNYDKTVRVK